MNKRIVDFLYRHPLVERVNHPSLPGHPDHALYSRYFPNGAGSIFTFDIWGGGAKAKKFCENLKLFSLLANVADAKSLVIHPASTTHCQLNELELTKARINPSTIRLSIGIEHVEDLIRELDKAFTIVVEP